MKKMKINDRKFLTPCFGDKEIFKIESLHCSQCQHFKWCKRVIMLKHKKAKSTPLKTPKNTISHLNSHLKKMEEQNNL